MAHPVSDASKTLGGSLCAHFTFSDSVPVPFRAAAPTLCAVYREAVVACELWARPRKQRDDLVCTEPGRRPAVLFQQLSGGSGVFVHERAYVSVDCIVVHVDVARDFAVVWADLCGELDPFLVQSPHERRNGLQIALHGAAEDMQRARPSLTLEDRGPKLTPALRLLLAVFRERLVAVRLDMRHRRRDFGGFLAGQTDFGGQSLQLHIASVCHGLAVAYQNQAHHRQRRRGAERPTESFVVPAAALKHGARAC